LAALTAIIPIQVALLITWDGSPSIGIIVPREAVIVEGIAIGVA
jgi:hypothetical protein